MIRRTIIRDGELVTEEVSPSDFYRSAQSAHEEAMTDRPPTAQEERVARAIVLARGVDPDSSMWRRVAAHGTGSDFEHAYFMWEDALAEARAAIAAMGSDA